jgi:PPOX class probable F420-dependent enzyme
MTAVPEDYLDLLERPTFANLATVRPDGTPQVNPMWFAWDGSVLRFTHTSQRQKFRNITANPHVAVAISDPDNPYRYLEVRGEVTDVTPDPEGAFYRELAVRYGRGGDTPPKDAAVRVILSVSITHATWM